MLRFFKQIQFSIIANYGYHLRTGYQADTVSRRTVITASKEVLEAGPLATKLPSLCLAFGCMGCKGKLKVRCSFDHILFRGCEYATTNRCRAANGATKSY